MLIKPSGNPLLPWQIKCKPTTQYLDILNWCRSMFEDEGTQWLPTNVGLQFRYFEDAVMVTLVWSDID